MKKKTVFLLATLMFGCGCSPMPRVKKEKIPFDKDYSQICEEGLLPTFDVSPETWGKNLLPIGYYGNYPDTGVFEFGGMRGEPSGSKCPDMKFAFSGDSITLLFSVVFEKNPLQFPTNLYEKNLGFSYCIKKDNKEFEKKEYYFRADRFSEIFSEEKLGYAHVDTIGRASMSVFTKKNALLLSLKLNHGESIGNITFKYGDVPQRYLNVTAHIATNDVEENIMRTYDGNDCTRLQYTKKLGSKVEFNLISQYGYCYSVNYLMNSFLVKDEQDNFQEHITQVEDPQDYFATASKAPIGSKYDVLFRVKNSYGKEGTVTFHFTVMDKKPPLISKRVNDEFIKVSYKNEFKYDFVRQYFDVTDNFDSECSTCVVDLYGNPIRDTKLGKMQVQIKAWDSSNNTSYYPFLIERIDDIPPVIKTTQNELTIPKGKVMTSDKILALFSCEDEIDGDIIPVVEENTYIPNFQKVGNYTFKVSATDSSGNKAEKAIDIYVVEPEAPIFFAKESFLTFAEGNIPSEKEIIQSLIREQVLPDKNYVSTQLLEGDRISQDMKAGDYFCSMQFFADDSTSEVVDLTIKVLEKKNMGVEEDETYEKEEEVKEEKELSFWERFVQWWKDLWDAIVRFFTGGK